MSEEEQSLIVSEKSTRQAYLPGLEWRTGEKLLSLPNVMSSCVKIDSNQNRRAPGSGCNSARLCRLWPATKPSNRRRTKQDHECHASAADSHMRPPRLSHAFESRHVCTPTHPHTLENPNQSSRRPRAILRRCGTVVETHEKEHYPPKI